MNWWKGLKQKLLFNEPLKNHTNFRIGGEARFFARPRSAADLKSLLSRIKKYKIPFFVMGAGSNILARDKGIEGLVLKMDTPYFKKISPRGRRLIAGCSVPLARLLREARRHGLSGLEFSVGIPGTVGGALAMNAGAWGKDMSAIVEKVKVMDYNGRVKFIDKEDLGFSYRKSGLGKYIILGAVFKLYPAAKKEIAGGIRDCLKKRRASQGDALPNAGCIFKNPAGDSAGRLIDFCGLKGKIIGGACISGRHANFILNRRKASSADVLKLMALMRSKVKERFGISLQPEIKIWQ
ncbi:MAG: UDP-N-acetylmuramate dehydrogenase [Candidatus Omnitrophota bacterium]|nr:UDP-N-acetylmuramate dehydrogenase [Candidatus Omnitrophota bacterium]